VDSLVAFSAKPRPLAPPDANSASPEKPKTGKLPLFTIRTQLPITIYIDVHMLLARPMTATNGCTLKPRGTAIDFIALSELFSEQNVLSVGIADLQWDQNDQKQQHVPVMSGKCNPAKGQIDKHVHGVLDARVQTVRYQISCLGSHRKRLS
jgi:hypothetical protein